MRQRQSHLYEQALYSQQIKQFLSNYKVQICQNPYPHHPPYCYKSHNGQEKRRNPYKDHGFLYLPSQTCYCSLEDCNQCHNSYEYYYHPLIYKTQKCPHYICQAGLFCFYYHPTELQLLMRYQFFRFDLESFKTEICPNRQQPSNMHQLASCRFYHNDSDKRRNPRKATYSHVQCETKSCNSAECQFAHNKIQQLYHPARYKTKYCQTFINKKVCQYSQYCSFAHSDEEIKIQLLHLMVVDQVFLRYKYKTVWCPYTNPHDRGSCLYAHNFQDYRRDPKKKNYLPENCPFWSRGEIKSIQASGCESKLECNKSHGWLEHKFHPITRMKESKLQSQQNQGQKLSNAKSTEKKKAQSNNSYGVGAPFFQNDEKPQKSQSQKGNSVLKQKLSLKSKDDTQKGFKFSFFLPASDESWSNQNNENFLKKNEIEQYWKHETLSSNLQKVQNALKDGKSLKKSKNLRKSKVEYTKSLKQLITHSLEEKLMSYKINQIKLLNLSRQDLQQFDMSTKEKQQIMKIIKEYSGSHKHDGLKYSESFTRIFRARKLGLTVDKLRKMGVTQSYLQRCSESTIQEFSFLQEDEKSTLPKIIDQYADDHAFRQLNQLIEEQTNANGVKQEKKLGDSDSKT